MPRRLPRAKTAEHPCPVLLVPGTTGIAFPYWDMMVRRFMWDGYRVFATNLPLFAIGDIAISAAHVAKEVKRIKAYTGAEQVNLVGHSMGGFIVRYYLKFLGGAKHVHTCVTIGTPHHWTYAAFLAYGLTAMRQITPGSGFLKKLNDGEEAPPPVRYASIYSVTDETCIPYWSCHLEGAENKVLLLCGHVGELVSRRVYAWTKLALDRP